MKIAVIGGTGLLGTQLNKIHSNLYCFGSEVDVSNKFILYSKLDELKPDIVMHLAAIKDSIYVEKNPIEAIQINIIGTANVSMWCSKNNCRLVYISTDYVYNSTLKNEHSETDGVKPFNLYAQSKLGGECSVLFVKNHCIIRTSFGDTKFPYKAAYTNLLVSKDYVDIIAPMILKVAVSNYVGIINIGTESKTMFEYAQRRNNVIPINLFQLTNFKLNTTLYNELFNS